MVTKSSFAEVMFFCRCRQQNKVVGKNVHNALQGFFGYKMSTGGEKKSNLKNIQNFQPSILVYVYVKE